MKKLILFAVVAMLSVTAASAQIVSSSSRSLSVKTEPKVKKESSGQWYFAYESPAFKYEGEAGDRLHGFATGYISNVALGSELPLFLNWGATLNYARTSDKNSDYTSSVNLLHFAVPVGFSYALPLSDNVSIVPALGINLRVGALANSKIEYSDSDYYEWNSDESFYDGDYAWSRFTMGMYLGGAFEFSSTTLGVYYITDFMPVVEDGAKYSAISLRLGFKF